MATLSQYMLSSAATFSFFLSIGSVSVIRIWTLETMVLNYERQVIRNDELLPPMAGTQRQMLPPLVHSRIDGATMMRARWAMERAKAHQALEAHQN